MTVLCEEGISCIHPNTVSLETPTGFVVEGNTITEENIVAVSIVRSGQHSEDSLIVIYCRERCIDFLLISVLLE